MKEHDFIKIIKNTLNSKHIGDDCAYLKDLEIVISQDNLVEDVHFSTKYSSAYDIGYKSAMVNISDIAASGAIPKYMTVALSLPNTTDEIFIENFYKGLKKASENIEIIGGDLTVSDKIFISITVIGETRNRKISSRSNAKAGYKIIVSGNHGSSAAGLIDLQNNKKSDFIKAHLYPQAQLDFSKFIAENINSNYAMMDTSDGLMDSLIQISQSSKVRMDIDFDKIPYDKNLEKYENYRDLIFYGGEDYQLIACVPDDFVIKNEIKIGTVREGFGVFVDRKPIKNSDLKIFNHFE